ncbi:hypothetical protein AB0H37_12765 [Actinomadura sp. NPDC023710]|uniref:hypothetical protein n=1 Tax=Actinomadura sp. NPDC023710 TaxID=3158219 RepID=UPI0033CAEB8C
MYEIYDDESFPAFRTLLFAAEQVLPERAARMTRHALEELELPYAAAQNAERFAYELMLNAYQHTTGVDLASVGDAPLPRHVRLEVGTIYLADRPQIRVAVFDQGDPFHFGGVYAGRGLSFVRTFAPRYGCLAASPRGKVVWAEV